jgi:hypothetical protein
MEGDLTVHICDPSYSGGRDRRISVQSQHKQKLARSYIKKKKKARHIGTDLQFQLLGKQRSDDQGSRPAHAEA